MDILKAGWSPALIMVLAVAGYMNEWPIEILAPGLFVILFIGVVVASAGARERELERASLRLKELAGYFNRRFAGTSSLSIFTIIDSLFNVEDPRLWDWARACDMSQRILNTWCDSFIRRVESDIRVRRFTLYLHTYLNELWLANSHYYEFVEQLREVAEKLEIPRETIDQYNRFVTEYNAFVQHFREQIVGLRKVAKTEIEPPSVKLAQEISTVKRPQVVQEEVKPPQPPPPTEHKGYIM